MSTARTESAGQIEDYIRALDDDIRNHEMTDDVMSNESRFIPLFKRALSRFELGGSDPKSLVDAEAQEIQDDVRLAKDILSEQPRYFPQAPTLLDRICPALLRGGEDIGDALNIATSLATLPAVMGLVPTQLGYAVIAFSLVRLGVRAVCSNRQKTHNPTDRADGKAAAHR
jgi:hypothetical protein